MGSISLPNSLPHIAFFPFMAKGHTLPLIHLAHLIHRRGLATLTFFTTPLNAPFTRQSLSGTDSAIIELPFSQNVPNLPLNAESTDQLPSLAYFIPFVDAVKLLRPHFERALQSLPTISFLISDGFLPWTGESAAKFKIPRIVFYGMGNFSFTMQSIMDRDRPFDGLDTAEQVIVVPGLPHVRLTKHDLCAPFDGPDPQGPFLDFIRESNEALRKSRGMIVNSFYQLDATYFDYWNRSFGPKAWCIGPLCLVKVKVKEVGARPALMEWLDSKLEVGRPVVYVAFGTQVDVSEEQLQEIAVGLELSGLDFLWVVRSKGVNLGKGFEDRVADKGKVVRDWVDQCEILQHPSIKGFVSHCGWSSTLESICAGVPILAWPIAAEQHLNAKFIVDELKIGVRAHASDGTKDGLVKGEDLAKYVKELVVGERTAEFVENVKFFAEEAGKAFHDNGSSWKMLEQMIDEVSKKYEF